MYFDSPDALFFTDTRSLAKPSTFFLYTYLKLKKSDGPLGEKKFISIIAEHLRSTRKYLLGRFNKQYRRVMCLSDKKTSQMKSKNTSTFTLHITANVTSCFLIFRTEFWFEMLNEFQIFESFKPYYSTFDIFLYTCIFLIIEIRQNVPLTR